MRAPDQFRELLLEKLKWRVMLPVSEELVRLPDELDVVASYLERQWYISADWHIPGHKRTTTVGVEYVPTSWWQAFKAEVFPAWLQAWFPVREREIPVRLETIKVCPMLGPWPSKDHRHWTWFEEP